MGHDMGRVAHVTPADSLLRLSLMSNPPSSGSALAYRVEILSRVPRRDLREMTMWLNPGVTTILKGTSLYISLSRRCDFNGL